MNKLISVWGKNGSGKSTTAANLACAIASRGTKTALVSASRFYGSIQHFFDMEFSPEQSLRAALTGRDSLTIQSYFCPCPKVKNLHIASLSNQDECIGYQKPGTSTVIRLINLLKSGFEVGIADCDESTEDPLSMHCLVNSDSVVYITRPNIQSAVFAKSYRSVISGLNIDDRIMTVFIDDGRHGELNEYDTLGLGFRSLPFCDEIARADCDSAVIALTKSINRSSSKYKKVISEIADTVTKGSMSNPGAAEI